MRQATAEYREEQDHFGAFIEEACVIHPQTRTGATALYQAYRAWAESAGEKPESQTRFGTRLRERDFAKKATPRIVWLGIGLRDDRPDPDDGAKQSREPLNGSEAENVNRLNGKSPIDTGVVGDEVKGLNSLKLNIDDSGLPIARVGEFSKKGLEPFNPLNGPVEQGPLPGEVDFEDDVAENTPEKSRPVAQPGRRLTEEEVEQVRKLVGEGMSPASARAEVIGEEKEF